jgi:hypothetical protein
MPATFCHSRRGSVLLPAFAGIRRKASGAGHQNALKTPVFESAKDVVRNFDCGVLGSMQIYVDFIEGLSTPHSLGL